MDEQENWRQVMDDREWALPSEPGIKLDQGELLLLDWVLCGASRLIPNADLDYLLEKWHDFRLAIWGGIGHLKSKNVNEIKLGFTDPEAKALLALVPTTFRWGTGPDCGYTLKQKLSKFLMGDLNYDHENKTYNAPGDKPASGPAA